MISRHAHDRHRHRHALFSFFTVALCFLLLLCPPSTSLYSHASAADADADESTEALPIVEPSNADAILPLDPPAIAADAEPSLHSQPRSPAADMPAAIPSSSDDDDAAAHAAAAPAAAAPDAADAHAAHAAAAAGAAAAGAAANAPPSHASARTPRHLARSAAGGMLHAVPSDLLSKHANLSSLPVRHRNHLHAPGYDPERRVAHGSHSHSVAEYEDSQPFILLVILGSAMCCQLGLWLWKRKYTASYEVAALFGLWLIPFIWSVYSSFTRMLLLWLAYTAVTAFVMHAARRSPVHRSTPRLVYQYFYTLYRACYTSAFAGYLFFMSDFLGFSLLLPHSIAPLTPMGFVLLFYGIYYGVLSRDLCEWCSTRMAVNIGYIARKGDIPNRTLPSNTCAICDHKLFASIRLTDQPNTNTTSISTSSSSSTRSRTAILNGSSSGNGDGQPGGGVSRTSSGGGDGGSADEAIFTLACGHRFHEFCLRGWTIIGKRDTCAYCNEKVRLRELFSNPWEQTTLAWAVLLDAMRYMIVFNPIILLVSQGLLYILY